MTSMKSSAKNAKKFLSKVLRMTVMRDKQANKRKKREVKRSYATSVHRRMMIHVSNVPVVTQN